MLCSTCGKEAGPTIITCVNCWEVERRLDNENGLRFVLEKFVCGMKNLHALAKMGSTK